MHRQRHTTYHPDDLRFRRPAALRDWPAVDCGSGSGLPSGVVLDGLAASDEDLEVVEIDDGLRLRSRLGLDETLMFVVVSTVNEVFAEETASRGRWRSTRAADVFGRWFRRVESLGPRRFEVAKAFFDDPAQIGLGDDLDDFDRRRERGPARFCGAGPP